MIIVAIGGGIGNQLGEYALARLLANKWNTELKIDKSFFSRLKWPTYVFDKLNITATIATTEEINYLKNLQDGSAIKNVGKDSIEEILKYPDNVYLTGYPGGKMGILSDIRDILLKEFSLKYPLSPKAAMYKEKILSAECAVSMHFRLGDLFYHDADRKKYNRFITPMHYYYNSIKALNLDFKNLTLFAFSSELQYVKENFHSDFPIEFVEGCEEDLEEIYLMSICKHNIADMSSFSLWGAYINQNPERKLFIPIKSNIEGVQYFERLLNNKRVRYLDSWDGIKTAFVNFDINDDQIDNVKIRPYFSILLVVNNDAETISETLASIFEQNYGHYELIIIDNASFDGSYKICRKAIKDKENVMFKKLHSPVKNTEAWNMALNMAQGYYVYLLKGNDLFTANNILAELYLLSCRQNADIIHLFSWLEEKENGEVALGDKKYSEQRDFRFQKITYKFTRNDGQETVKFLLNQEINHLLGTKIFDRKFLLKNEIEFDEKIDDKDSEFFFQIEAFFKSKNILFVPNAFYIAPPRKQ